MVIHKITIASPTALWFVLSTPRVPRKTSFLTRGKTMRRWMCSLLPNQTSNHNISPNKETQKARDQENTMSPPVACSTMAPSVPMAMAVPVPDDNMHVVQGQSMNGSSPPAFRTELPKSKLSEQQIKRLMEQGYSRGKDRRLHFSPPACCVMY